MFVNVERERERDWCRHVKVSIASADRQVEREREREREREVCVCVCVCVFFLNFVSFFFYSGDSSTYFKVLCRYAKKSDRTRCLAVSILEYNLGPNITGVRGTILTGIRSRQSVRKRFDF